VHAEHLEQRVREIFRLAVAREVGFEVNTSGLRRVVGVSHPEPEMIAWYIEEGGQIVTVGSDSHTAEDTGHSIPETYARLRELGITWRTSFVGGRVQRVELPTG
jgi:histidinol-phosphatase (PHP family)